ncbi:MAG TPA: hypothetical protein VK763_03270 [Terriglobales bacterium]|jgi:hypothetical protein|nr:hypothetical protein [Terriglobales bacterium]
MPEYLLPEFGDGSGIATGAIFRKTFAPSVLSAAVEVIRTSPTVAVRKDTLSSPRKES